MSNAENYTNEWARDAGQEQMAQFAEQAQDFDFMLSMAPEERTAYWHETLEDFGSDYNAREFAADAIKPLNEGIKELMPECDLNQHPAAYHGAESVNWQLRQQEKDFETAVQQPNGQEPDLELMAAKAEAAYSNALANNNYFASALDNKDEDTARWVLAKLGVAEWLSQSYDIGNPMETWLNRPENQAALTFIESFPQDELDLFTKLHYPNSSYTSINELWKDPALLEHDARLIVALYGEAMAKHPLEHDALAEDIDATDNNVLRAQITAQVTQYFLDQYRYTVVSMEKNDDDDDPYVDPEDVSIQFNEPEHDQIADMIEKHFGSRLTSVETSIRAGLDHGNAETLISAITDLDAMQDQQQLINGSYDPEFMGSYAPEEHAQIKELYGSYRDKLIAAMLEEASQHVTDDLTLHEAMKHIDVRPTSALDMMIQHEWLDANHPTFMATTAGGSAS